MVLLIHLELGALYWDKPLVPIPKITAENARALCCFLFFARALLLGRGGLG